MWDGDEGEVTTKPQSQPLGHWEDIIKSWGYDPAVYQIVEPVKVSTWEAQTSDGTQQLWSYKAGIRIKSNAAEIDFDDLIKEIKRHRPLNEKLPTGNSAFVVNIADTQFGKADGDGLRGTIERFQARIDLVENRIRELRKAGRPLGHLIVAGLGDIIEGCDGNYSTQIWAVEANRRQQVRIAVRLIRDAIARWAKLFKEVTVLCVPGNHGENRKDGRAFTDVGDNDDVAVFERLAEIFAENPKAYGHISFLIPENEIYVVLPVNGWNLGFTHGHVTKGGGSPQAKIRSWWEDQSFGNQPIGDAEILVTAHYHHFSWIEYNVRKIHLQCPTIDGGSEWWVNLSGEHSRPGFLTFVVEESGLRDVEII